MPAPPVFDERTFYLREFRGRTLAIALPHLDEDEGRAVVATLDELAKGEVRVVLLGGEGTHLTALGATEVVDAAAPRFEGAVWRGLRDHGRIGVRVASGPDGELEAAALLPIARSLGLFKLVWLHREGGLRTRDGERQSFIHLDELHGLVDDDGAGLVTRERLPLWHAIMRMIDAGLPAVNVCAPAGLGDELFTYAGSGTLFTRENYLSARRLGVDDYDAAADLIRRGVEEGYLAPRDDAAIDRVLAAGIGAFVEDRHLAGIGALLVSEHERAGEIASLYTLTRFLGEGVGPVLLEFAAREAWGRGLERIFACTTSERVGAFFERNGYRRVAPETLPPEKWVDYAAERRDRVLCFELRPTVVAGGSAG